MMLFLVRLLLSLAVFLLLDLPMLLLGLIVLALVLPFIPKGRESLPKCLAWFDNHSGIVRGYPMGDGLSGDPLYRKLRAANGHTNLFWERYYWLALRNPTNHFSYVVLGHKYSDRAKVMSIKGPLDPERSRGGFKRLEAVDFEDQLCFIPMGGVYHNPNHEIPLYEYYYTKYYTLFGRKFYVRFRMGYKVVDDTQIVPGEYVEQVLSFNPFQPDR